MDVARPHLGEQRFSPLKQINDSNVQRLGLAWFAPLNTYPRRRSRRRWSSTVCSTTSPPGISPPPTTPPPARCCGPTTRKIAPEWARLACCGPVSRGLAAWHGKIIIAALDGRLIAVDAKTGKPVWTHADHRQGTAAVAHRRAAHRRRPGGHRQRRRRLRRARLHIAAYDADHRQANLEVLHRAGRSGAMPEGAASDSIMPMAAKTWSGEWWKVGGGGNDWDAIVYDPKLDLVYFGTGNGSPHPQHFRSPGGGDNLFLCSIVAVNAHTGHYVWHYQEVPAEQWDYDCTAPLILADLKIDGKVRQVIMHAPKDGFFYVLDRATGKLISAKNFVPNTWASHVDLKTGRPAINPDAYVAEKPHLITPSCRRRPQLESDVLQPADRAGLHPDHGAVDGGVAPAGRAVQVRARAVDARRRCQQLSGAAQATQRRRREARQGLHCWPGTRCTSRRPSASPIPIRSTAAS